MLATQAIVQNKIVATIAKPDDTFRWTYLVNCGPVIDAASDSLGWGTRLFEDGLALVDTGTPAVGEKWGVASGQWGLRQHRPGFLITGTTQAVGGNTCVCALQLPPGEVLVQNDTGSPIAAGGTGIVNLYGGAAGTTDLGLEVAVTNGSSVSWASTKYGWATADAGGLIFVSPYQT